MFNLHTHTIRCHHASGEDRAYVEAAIKAGYTEMGFSDHAPMIFPEDSGYSSHFRMSPDDMEGYVKSVLDLKREYAADIRIYLGLETEYYPKLFERNLAFYNEYPLDYMVMGQHFVGNEFDLGSVYPSKPTADDGLLRRYVGQVLDGLATGAFTYLAHPDLPNFIGDKHLYRFEAERLCRGAMKYGVPLELNRLGFFEGRCYPNKLFWEVVRETGNDIVIGLDAHSPDVYGDRATVEKLEKWAKKMKLNITGQMPVFKDPKKAKLK